MTPRMWSARHPAPTARGASPPASPPGGRRTTTACATITHVRHLTPLLHPLTSAHTYRRWAHLVIAARS
ncbi:hypothetical protein HFP72_00010 [Nocardiopsis sp. ARC36]